MERAIDPKYRFNFSNLNGRQYHRKCFWENRYVFFYNNDRVLVATRVVPCGNMQEALYTAFRGQRGDTLTQHLLPEAFRQAQLNVFNNESQMQRFADNISALVPGQASNLPDSIIEETEAQIEEIASRIMIGQGFERGLGSFASDETTPFLARDKPTDPMQYLVSEDEEDKALVQISYRIDATIKARLRDILQSNNEDALVKHGDIEFDIATRLYTNPNYLGFVRRLIDARGSYLSPVVRDFLGFYSHCFNLKFKEHIRHSNDDPGILRKRVESILGREKTGIYHHLDYHDLTILGRIEEGNLKPDTDDPDQTVHGYKLCDSIASQALLLSEIKDPVPRFMIRKFIEHAFNAHHNIKTTQYIDESQKRKIPVIKHLPDPVERVLCSGIEKFENWLDNLEPNMIQVAITAFILCILGVAGVVLGTLIHLLQ